MKAQIPPRQPRPYGCMPCLKPASGAFCLVWPLILSVLGALYVLIHRNITSEFYTLSLIRFLLTFAVILIPSTLMGGTLPVLTRFFCQETRTTRHKHRSPLCTQHIRCGYRDCGSRIFPARSLGHPVDTRGRYRY